jgi:adenylosuccinate lyase
VALRQAQTLLGGLIVDAGAMRGNLARFGDQLASEHVLAALTPRLGKHQAQQLMHELLAPGRGEVQDVVGTLIAAGVVAEADRAALSGGWAIGDAPAMVDAVVARGRTARASEPEVWM